VKQDSRFPQEERNASELVQRGDRRAGSRREIAEMFREMLDHDTFPTPVLHASHELQRLVWRPHRK